MFPTCTDLKNVQGALPVVGKVVKDLVKRLGKIFKWATSKPFPSIEMCHYVIRE